MKSHAVKSQRLLAWARRVFCIAVMWLGLVAQAQAQWSSSGNNIYNTNTGNVGIGTQSPATQLHVMRDWNTGASTNIMAAFDSYDDQSRMILRRANGNAGSETQVLSGQNIGGLQFRGWTSAGSFSANSAASITALAAENFTGTGIGSIMQFTTTPIGSTTPTVRMTLDANGYLGIGTTGPGFKLDVQGGAINASGGLCISGICKSDWSQVGNSQWANGSGFINYSSGYVGIGTPTPSSAYKLDVQGGSINASGGLCIASICKSDWSQVATQWTTTGTSQIYYNSGNVGVGTNNPASKLFVGSGTPAVQILAGLNVALGGPSYVATSNGTENMFMGADGSGYGILGTLSNHGVGIRTNNTERMRIDTAGNVGLGTQTPTERLEVNGNLKVTGTGTGNITASGTIEGGNIKARYQDVAEWVESSQELNAGTVVILDSSKSNQVIASNSAYDSRVAGVISLQPGITLGEHAEGRVLVATTGRVKVKVDASNGSINIGDLLVTSDKPGVAMKSQPVEIGGVRIHRPGTLIGKALEPLERGTGEILVLLSLQ